LHLRPEADGNAGEIYSRSDRTAGIYWRRAFSMHFPFKLPTGIPDWADAILQRSLVNLPVPFLVDRWMARRYGGREAAGTLALAFLHAAINLCAGLVFFKAARSGLSMLIDAHLLGCG
jgi:hypothetical protein